MSLPDDVEGVNRPTSLAFGEKDSLVDATTRGKIIDVMATKKEVEHEVRVYEGQVHGFASRGDWSGEEDRKAMDEVTRQGMDWMNKYL